MRMAISTTEHPWRWSPSISSFSRTSSLYGERLTVRLDSCLSESQFLAAQNGHLAGRESLDEVHFLPQWMQECSLGGTFQHLEPQLGHLFGLPFWEFHLCPQRRHSTKRLGLFHFTERHSGQRFGSSFPRGNQS